MSSRHKLSTKMSLSNISKKASNNIIKFKINLRYSDTHQKVIDFDYNIDSDKPSKIAKELVDEKLISTIDQKDILNSIKKLIKNPDLYYTSFKSGDIDDDSDENIYVKYKRIGQKARLPYAKKLPKGYIQIELVPKDKSNIVIVNEYELIAPGNNTEKYSNSNQQKINLKHKTQQNNNRRSYTFGFHSEHSILPY